MFGWRSGWRLWFLLVWLGWLERPSPRPLIPSVGEGRSSPSVVLFPVPLPPNSGEGGRGHARLERPSPPAPRPKCGRGEKQPQRCLVSGPPSPELGGKGLGDGGQPCQSCPLSRPLIPSVGEGRSSLNRQGLGEFFLKPPSDFLEFHHC